MTVEGVSVVIPSFNGRRLLEANLPPLLAALEASPFPTELVVVDDGSTDGTPAFLAETFPQVVCVALPANVGVIGAKNEGLAHARYPYVCILDNDIVVPKGFLEPLAAHFADPEVFAVCSKALDPAGRPIASRMGIAFEQGRLKLQRNDDRGTLSTAAPTVFALGGQSLFDKAKLLSFGGFDVLYEPSYMFGVDSSWQAWAAGWRVVYEPASVIVHDHLSTMGNIWSRGIRERLHRRSEWLFTWKHLNDRGLWLQHVLFVPLLLLAAPFAGRINLTLSFFQALAHLGAVREARRRAQATRRLSEQEIIRRVMVPPPPPER